MPQKSLKKNAFYGFIKAFMNLAFPIISFPYASRVLMPEGIGKVNFANSIIDYFLMIAGLGIGAYATREASRIRDNHPALNKFAREMISINFIAMSFSYILFFIALLAVPKFSEYRILLIVCATKILFQSLGLEWLYFAEEEYRYITMRSIFFQCISLVFLFSFIKSKDDYVLYALMGVISSVGSNIFNLVNARKYINIFEVHKIELRIHLKKIFIFFGMGFAVKLYSIIDTTMLGFIQGDAQVGYYTAANKMTGMTIGLITAAISTLLPRGTYYFEKKRFTEYHALIEKAAGAAAFFSFPACAGLFLLCEPVIILFSGRQYLPAAAAMKILAPLVILLAFCSMLNNLILNPQRKERFMFLSQITACITNFILNYWLIHLYGVRGAAIATFFSQLSVLIVLIFCARKDFFSKKTVLQILQVIIATTIMATAVTAVLHFIHGNLQQIFSGLITGVVSYASITILMKNETALMIIKMLKKIRLQKK
jgi:O-antigen/teichoic acid export membrane protein